MTRRERIFISLAHDLIRLQGPSTHSVDAMRLFKMAPLSTRLLPATGERFPVILSVTAAVNEVKMK